MFCNKLSVLMDSMQTARTLTAALVTGTTLLLSGCNSTPYDRATIFYDRAQFPVQVDRDIALAGESILQHGRCTVLLSTPGSKTGTYNFCTFALTADALYIEGWNAAALKYEEIVRIDLSKIRQVALETLFRTSQVQLLEPQRLTAFSVMIDEGGYHDTDATERVFEMIKNAGVRVGSSDGMVQPPAPSSPTIIPVVIPQ